MRNTRTDGWRRLQLGAAAALVLAVGLGAAPRVQEAGPVEAPAADGPVDPKVVEVLRDAFAYLARVEQFTVRAEAWNDVALDDRATVQYESAVELALRRPDRLRITVAGDLEDRELWYDGERVGVREEGYYASTEARATIEETLAFVEGAYDVSFPLQGLARGAPGREHVERLEHAAYLGVHRAGGVPCHHLLWSEPDVDVEIWIATGERPLLQRLAIDYKTEPGAPRFQASLRDWDLAPELGDEVFEFTPPEGAEEIQIVTPGEKPR